MIHFTLSEIIISILGSVVFGILFSFLFACIQHIAILPEYLFLIFKKNDFKDFIKYEKKQCGFGLTLLMFFLFAIGFILLSYCFLDGCVRAYMLCISLLFFFISKKVAFRAVTVIIFLTLNALFFIPAKIWRRKRY